jgi:hypothetical protein
MESRPHGRDLQTPIYPLPDGSVKGNIGVILNCALNHVRFRAAMQPHVVHGGMRNLECACLWQASATKDCGYRSAQ